ncbi:MAG TPA: G5 domain-containing protein [Candidatus Limnocylindria bacterium]|nr:G5 domain-containing protein [Candidatus Limnocylindria bacterium]
MERAPVATPLRHASLWLITFVAFAASWQLASSAAVVRAFPSLSLRVEPAARGGLLSGRASVEAGARSSSSGLTVSLAPGLPVTVLEGGSAQLVRAPRGATVGETLDLAGVQLGPLDRVVARPDGAVVSGDVIRVLRVTEVEVVAREALPFPVATVADPALVAGRSFVAISGVPGLAENTYRVSAIDGMEAERVLIGSVTLQAPIAEVRHVGTRIPPGPSEIDAIIRAAAADWGADADQLLRVAWCESRYNPSAYNASSGASGLFQFMAATWTANSARAGYGGASVFDPVASANTAAFMFSIGQSRQWACK